MHVIYIANDNLVEVRGLRDRVTGAYINDAVVAATLKDALGANVSGATWPIPLDYVAASDGEYRGTAPSTLGLEHGETYFAEIVATGAGKKATWRQPLRGQWRAE